MRCVMRAVPLEANENCVQLELDQLEQQQHALQGSAAEGATADLSEEERFVQEMLSDGLTAEQGKAQVEALAECFQQV